MVGISLLAPITLTLAMPHCLSLDSARSIDDFDDEAVVTPYGDCVCHAKSVARLNGCKHTPPTLAHDLFLQPGIKCALLTTFLSLSLCLFLISLYVHCLMGLGHSLIHLNYYISPHDIAQSVLSLYLSIGSLYVLRHASRRRYRHGIKKSWISRGVNPQASPQSHEKLNYRRISLTIRRLLPHRKQVTSVSAQPSDHISRPSTVPSYNMYDS